MPSCEKASLPSWLLALSLFLCAKQKHAKPILDMEEKNTNLPHAVRSGLIAGMVSVLITLVVYIVDVTIFSRFFLFIALALILSFGFGIYFGNNHRKSIGGYKDYGPAFVHAFMLFLVSGLVNSLFSFVLFGLVDPAAVDVIQEAGLERTAAMLERVGMSGEDIDNTMEEARKAQEEQGNPYSLAAQGKQFIWRILFFAIG
ncbi:MAG TPA: hypothetical protein DCP28_32360, partial [Cytophagales bacterium]|nr:hypothetical protein [Cytophagales bacterium]